MMKRIILTMMVLAVTLTVIAQVKLTPQAGLSIARQKAKMERKAARKMVNGQSSMVNGQVQTVRLIVKMETDKKAETLHKLVACGARLEGRIGQQVVISLPIDSVERIAQLDGVLRIDTGRKGHLKSDVSRQETGVNLLNGPAAVPDASPSGIPFPLTGKGVIICLMDLGFDYQHPAFKHADGTSRIKCVYRITDDGGTPFTVTDPDFPDLTYTLPGSVYDTPELIATLTTDTDQESHGTHTASIAAGTLSPQGYGGMAPEADIVLIPLGELGGDEDACVVDGSPIDEEEDMDEEEEEEEKMEYEDVILSALVFAANYAAQSDQPVIFSSSMNSHDGPHDGTSAISEAIGDMSEVLIPVMSAGNEGESHNHISYTFTAETPVMNTLFSGVEEGVFGGYEADVETSGYFTNVAEDQTVKARITILKNSLNDQTTAWQSPTIIFTPGDELQLFLSENVDDEVLSEILDGILGIAIGNDDNGSVVLQVGIKGDLADAYDIALSVEAPEGTVLRLWDDMAGFKGDGETFVQGTNDVSAGDWTSSEGVISVGAYCANTQKRFFSGEVMDFSDIYTLGDIVGFSSYGVMSNGVQQPLVCAPGTVVVAAVNNYQYESYSMGDGMLWQGYPYDSMDGTSMACPTVSGIVALWLQACPTLTFDQVKDIMLHSCTNDDFTANDPVRWGYGKINAKAGVDYIQNVVTGISATLNDNGKMTNDKCYDLTGRRLSPITSRHSTLRKGLYIYNGHKVVIK